MNEKGLNIRDAIRKARDRVSRERNRKKCKRYYWKQVEKDNTDIVGEIPPDRVYHDHCQKTVKLGSVYSVPVRKTS